MSEVRDALSEYGKAVVDSARNRMDERNRNASGKTRASLRFWITERRAGYRIAFGARSGVGKYLKWVINGRGPGKMPPLGPLVELRDGRLLTIERRSTRTSSDDGNTWSAPRKIHDGPGPGIPSAESCMLLKTRAGTLVAVYRDNSTFKWAWDYAKHEAAADVRGDVWAIRSLDEGETWKVALAREIKAAGLAVDLNKVL